jgi:hypothetical protein
MYVLTVVFRILFHLILTYRDADEMSIFVTHSSNPHIVGSLDVFDVLPLGVTFETDLNSLLQKIS